MLMIENDEDARKVAKKVLESYGHNSPEDDMVNDLANRIFNASRDVENEKLSYPIYGEPCRPTHT